MKDFYDVVVVGGGISGSIAAIAAGRMGADVLLLERHGFPGGMLTAAGVGPMMSFHAGDKQVIRGITDELIQRLVKKDKSPGHIVDTVGFTYTVTPFDSEWMKHELENMLLESGCQLQYHTMAASAQISLDRIVSIIVCNKAGLSKVSGKIFIDATGDADISAWAGVDYSYGRVIDGLSQPMTMKIKMRGVNIPEVKKYIHSNPDDFPCLKGNLDLIDKAPCLSIGGFKSIFEKAYQNGKLLHPFGELLFFETNTPGQVIVNTTKIRGLNGCNPDDVTMGEIEGRRQARILVQFLIDAVPGFSQAELLYTGPVIGVRSTRQIVGLYTLSADDLATNRTFHDVIAHTGYPVDIHNPIGGETIAVFPAWGDVRSIPYRCLVNNRIKNIITVGRCISASFEAQSAIRTTPTAGAIGHAGGIAAAIAARGNGDATGIDTEELQQSLLHQNAYLEMKNMNSV